MGTSRSAIVDAALSCTRTHGWDATSLQTVRERAGVSNGTLFHHFPTRRALAAAVLAAGLADHQATLIEQLRVAPDARAGIRGVVTAHLRWVAAEPRLAGLLLAGGPAALRADLDPAALAANRAFFGEVAGWLGRAGWPGDPALPVVLALWIGPAQEYARGWLADPQPPLDEPAPAIADGAWHAVGPLLKKETP